MGKVDIENVILTGHIEGKIDRGKQQVAYETNLGKCLAEQKIGEIAKTKLTNN